MPKIHIAAEMMELTAPPQKASLSASPVELRAAALLTRTLQRTEIQTPTEPASAEHAAPSKKPTTVRNARPTLETCSLLPIGRMR